MNPLQQIEQETLEEGRELTRRMLEERLQTAADEMGAISPASGLKLKRARRIGLKLHTVCGVVVLRVWYGFCSHSGRNMSPARERWGLKPHQRFSPEFEKRMCYTAAQTVSYEKTASMAACWGSSVRLLEVRVRCAGLLPRQRPSLGVGQSSLRSGICGRATLGYRLLRYGQAYVDEGMQAYEERFKAARLRTCKQIAKEFGLTILEPEEAAA